MKNEIDNEEIANLACAIINRAVEDWRILINNKAWIYNYRSYSFDEIRSFFKGDWIDYLTAGTDVHPTEILAVLEKELQEAIEKYEKELERL